MAVLPDPAKGRSPWCCSTIERLIGVRDPHGFRPLCLGKLDQGWVLASETPALDITGAPLRPRARSRGAAGHRRGRPAFAAPLAAGAGSTPSCACSSSCTWPGRTAACTTRSCTGLASAWASCWPSRRRWSADMVMGVPDSGLPAAEGYARRSGIRYGQRSGQEPLHRPHLHRARPGPAGPGRAPQAQPAPGRHRRPAPGGRRRLHRAGHHHPGHGAHAARGRRRRGPPPHLVAAVPVAVLLRARHRYAGPS